MGIDFKNVVVLDMLIFCYDFDYVFMIKKCCCLFKLVYIFNILCVKKKIVNFF